MRLLFANLHVACGLRKPKAPLPEAALRARLKRASELMVESGALLIGLCEVDFRSRRSAYLDEARLLAQLTGFCAYPLVTYDCPPNAPGVPALFADCRYGLAWLVAPGIAARPLDAQWLPNPPEEGAAVSERRALFPLALNGRNGAPLFFGLTHLDHRSRATRLAQLARIGAALPAGPWVLAGDFNEPLQYAEAFDDAAAAALARLHDWPLPADSAWPERFLGQSPQAPKALWPSYPLPAPQAAIDHIFAGAGARVTALRPVDSGGVSDHRWLLAELAF